MNNKMTKNILPFFVLSLISVVFFYKMFIFGQIPFPGDLLVSEYSPWKFESYLGYNPGSYPSKVQYFDVLRQIYPWKTISIEILKNGQIPLWNPYSFAGAPLLANFQSSVFYPLNIVYFILPQIYGWSFLVFLQPFLASIFTYFYCRKIGIGKTASLLSSIAFSYSLFTTVFLEYNIIIQTVLWLPLLLYLIERLIEKLEIKNILFFIAATMFSFLAGHIQIFGFLVIFVFLYVFSRIVCFNAARRYKIKTLSVISLSIFFALGISSFQLLPTIELINNSARVSQSYQFLIEKLLIQPDQLILFLSPDFFGNPAAINYLLSDSYPGNAVYIGLIPVIFSFFSMFLFRKKYLVKFFITSTFILAFFITRSPFTEFFYSFEIPLFSTGSPTNSIFLLSFCLSILAGFGVDHWISNKSRKHLLILAAFLVIFIFVWLLKSALYSSVSTKNLLYSSLLFFSILPLFIFGSRFNKKKLTSILFIGILIIDLFYFFQKFNPFVPKDFVFPSQEVFGFLKDKAETNRFWAFGHTAILSNTTAQYSLFHPEGYDPLYPRAYGEFIQSSKDGKIVTSFDNSSRSDAFLAPSFGEEDFSKNQNRLKVLDLLAVKYIVDRAENGSTQKTFPENRFKTIYQKDGWTIQENLKALPHMFLANDYVIYKNNQEFEKIFFSEDFNPRKTVLLKESLMNFNLTKNQEAKLDLLSYTPNKITLNSESKENKILFVSDTYYPGWRALIDNEEVKIYKANHAFKAVIVPKGKHRVILEYWPGSFNLGYKISIISLLLLFALIMISRKKLYAK
ncbi:hypothetical protein C4577_05965 [Candidatus Parcubacteria bacterium]|nr:MAG: hypothetical protein C4577_05965 [Candidatus Parcubacteria bacterium]